MWGIKQPLGDFGSTFLFFIFNEPFDWQSLWHHQRNNDWANCDQEPNIQSITIECISHNYVKSYIAKIWGHWYKVEQEVTNRQEVHRHHFDEKSTDFSTHFLQVIIFMIFLILTNSSPFGTHYQCISCWDQQQLPGRSLLLRPAVLPTMGAISPLKWAFFKEIHWCIHCLSMISN